ncbi:hypothetical protein [Pseudomonas sp. NyZ201]|uniref:hypothetical protein n=1 Tax=Pseudomonas sp. NyZ201 TaxID=3409857 RepID=UPI003CEBEE86
MKRTLMLSLFVVTLVATAGAVTEVRLVEKRAQLHSCQVNPYSCVHPAVSFASLH